MAKEIDTPQGRAAATAEMSALFETMRMVKGAKYAAVVRGAFGLCNYHMAVAGIRDHLPEEAAKAFDVLQTAHDVAIRDVVTTLVRQHMAPCEEGSTCDCDARFEKLMTEIIADIKMLSDKQDEYGAFAFSGEPK